MNANTVIVLALVLEAVVNTVKWAFQKAYDPWRIGALVLGVALAVVYRIDLLASVGIVPTSQQLWWVGSVLSGLVMSRGANVVADFAKAIEGLHGEGDLEPSRVPGMDEAGKGAGGAV